MLPVKYQPNRNSGSGEEVVFTIYGHGCHLAIRIKIILAIFVP